MKYFVDATAATGGDGSEKRPFQKIQQAADLALPGDEILVYPGIYRENVHPVHAGTQESPICYRSVEPLKAVITGAQPLSNWVNTEGSVWKTSVENRIFTERNPYTTCVSGDWYQMEFLAHLGDIFLNGKSMYEVTNIMQVRDPKVSKTSWDPDFSVYTWYCEQDTEKDETVFYANFQGLDPNTQTVEMTVRAACFCPSVEGVGYITLSGFTVKQAATQWAPPTAYQEGMIGPHWSKGWIIEDCDISESKCSGISLGKYLQPDNDNKWLNQKYKDGTQTQRECVCQAQADGWSKETVGSHIVRRCNIHDCGQTGIVGHLGGVFSRIEDNHIHHINNKQNLAGAEIGGIKMHAAIDCVFRHNHIHHCTRGIWLDWQAQGTRVTGNLFHHNCLANLTDKTPIQKEIFSGIGEDIFIEVSHGPTLLDNNFFLSARAVKLPCQGVAMVHNLVAGSFVSIGIGTNNGAKTKNSARYTPYHKPHSTQIAGFMTFLHGDDRFYNNIFLRQSIPRPLRIAGFFGRLIPNDWDDNNISVGTHPFNRYPTFAQWDAQFAGYCGMGSAPSDRYYSQLPVWMEGNVYGNGAKAWQMEKSAQFVTDKVDLQLIQEGDAWYLETNLYDYLPTTGCESVNTEKLGKAFEPEQKFENPDGSPIDFSTDYFGAQRGNHPVAGPLQQGKHRMRVY